MDTLYSTVKLPNISRSLVGNKIVDKFWDLVPLILDVLRYIPLQWSHTNDITW